MQKLFAKQIYKSTLLLKRGHPTSPYINHQKIFIIFLCSQSSIFFFQRTIYTCEMLIRKRENGQASKGQHSFILSFISLISIVLFFYTSCVIGKYLYVAFIMFYYKIFKIASKGSVFRLLCCWCCPHSSWGVYTSKKYQYYIGY